MSGDLRRSAARMTPSIVMSSTVLKAATPYRFWNARFMMSGKDASHRSIAANIAKTYAARIFRSIGALLEADRAVPEPQLEHLFKVVLVFDQGEIELPDNARTVKVEIARRLIDRYYEGHSPEYRRKALEQLTKITE